jgi:DNA-3-methyladenine glycosylase I
MSDVSKEISRCAWCNNDPIYIAYHDNVWGKPEFDSQQLFEKLCLDGQQAGLSWITILKKLQGYRDAFANFDAMLISQYDADKVEELMLNPNIIRNRLKVNSIIKNAKAYLAYEEQNGVGSFSSFLWEFVGGKPIVNQWQDKSQVPTETEQSILMSKMLKKLGFNFVGPTICYAFMQAVGMVNDHLTSCISYHGANKPK